MNKKEQLQFIEAEYPLYTNHISNRRIRHDFLKIYAQKFKLIY